MFINITDIQPREVIKGYSARFIHTNQLTMAFWEVEAGATMPIHQHMHEQTSQVIEGEFELTVDGEPRLLKPGLVAVIPSNVSHGGVAVTYCKLLDTFTPAREDYQ